jgi:hypothetical protein
MRKLKPFGVPISDEVRRALDDEAARRNTEYRRTSGDTEDRITPGAVARVILSEWCERQKSASASPSAKGKDAGLAAAAG